MKRGIFITIYGINNIGKSTHAKRLVRRLKAAGKKAVYLKYPIYTLKPTGPLLNSILRSKKQTMSEEELQLWFVLNRFHFQPRLEALLKKGTIVIAEDYVGTALAWGAAKGADPKELAAMNTFLVQEDLAVFFHGKRDTKATEAQHIHETNNTLIARCQKEYERLAKNHKWTKVAVAADPEVTAGRLWKVISAHFDF